MEKRKRNCDVFTTFDELLKNYSYSKEIGTMVSDFFCNDDNDIMSVRGTHGIHNLCIKYFGRDANEVTMAEFCLLTEAKILGIRNIGKKTLYEIKRWLEIRGLTLGANKWPASVVDPKVKKFINWILAPHQPNNKNEEN